MAQNNILKLLNALLIVLDKALEPPKRIEKSWYASFMLRYWRKWIMLNNSYTLRNNFVTSNAFNGVELNAHEMVNFMRTIRDHAHNDSCFAPLVHKPVKKHLEQPGL